MKKIISVLLLFAGIATLSGCTSYKEQTLKMADIKDKCRIEGRYEVIKTAITCDWSASAIEFTADCKGTVSVNVTSEDNAYDMSCDGKEGLTCFAVYVDGKRTEDNIKVDNCTKDIVLAKDLKKGQHEFRLVRQTNVYEAHAQINSITLSGQLIDTPQNDILIEYIGDSYTTGYGIQGTHDDKYNHELDDATQAYAYKSAELLGADYMLSAFSGAGFAYGYTKFTVPEVYNSLNWFRDTKKAYEPTRTPDLIVLNLGTNDVSQVGFGAKDEFMAGVKKLFEEVFECYGKELPVVICTDTSHENNDPFITEAFDTYFPDVNYTLAELTKNSDGCNWHPSPAGGTKQADELAAAIKKFQPDLFKDK